LGIETRHRTGPGRSGRKDKEVQRVKKAFLPFIITALAIGIAPFFTACSPDGGKVTFGAIIALTGPASDQVDVRDGMLLAVDEINKRGGINGRRIELIVKDSRSDPDEGEKAFKEIERKDKPLVYFSTSSAVSMAVSPLAEKSNVVLMGLVVAATDFTKDKTWTYRFFTTTQDETKTVLAIAKGLKIRTLGILYQDEVYGISVKELLEAEFNRLGGIVAAEPYSAADPDFSKAMEKLRTMEAVYVIGYTNNAEAALKKLRESHYSGVIIGSSAFSGLAGRVPEVNGVYVASPNIYNRDYRFAIELREKFEKRYRRNLTHQAATGYEAVNLIAGLLNGKELTRDEVKRVLDRGFVFPCVFGDIEVAPGQHDIPIPLFPTYVEDDRIEYLQ
jgi:branched-chain amino acid transport system substrate-binding protein